MCGIAIMVLLGLIESKATGGLGLQGQVVAVLRYPSLRLCRREHTIAGEGAFAEMVVAGALHDVSIQYGGI